MLTKVLDARDAFFDAISVLIGFAFLLILALAPQIIAAAIIYLLIFR